MTSRRERFADLNFFGHFVAYTQSPFVFCYFVVIHTKKVLGFVE